MTFFSGLGAKQATKEFSTANLSVDTEYWDLVPKQRAFTLTRRLERGESFEV